jgi:hypothetical protein
MRNRRQSSPTGASFARTRSTSSFRKLNFDLSADGIPARRHPRVDAVTWQGVEKRARSPEREAARAPQRSVLDGT